MSSKREKRSPTEIAEILRSSPLFSDADSESIEEFASLAKQIYLRAGDPLFLEGEVGGHLYFIVAGSVEVLKPDKSLKRLHRLRVIGEGEYLGELSVLTKTPHSASCFAIEDSTLVAWDHQVFSGVVLTHAKVARNLVLHLADLNQKLTHSHNYVEYFRRNMMRLTPEIKALFPLAYLTQFNAIPVSLAGATLTIASTDPLRPEFISQMSARAPHILTRMLLISPDELARAREFVEKQFARWGNDAMQPPGASTPPPVPVASLRDQVKASSLFSTLESGLLDRLMPHFAETSFERGVSIFKPGTPSEMFYLVRSGTVSLTKEDGGKSEGGNLVALLGAGRGFGEISLLTNGVHSLHAKATEACQVATLSKKVLFELLKSPDFSMSLAKVLSERLQSHNRAVGVRFYPHPISFSALATSGLIPLAVIRERSILPLSLSGNELALGVVNADSELVAQTISRYLSAYRVTAFAITPDQFLGILKQINAKGSSAASNSTIALKSEAEGGSVIDFVDALVKKSVEERASDIHIEPMEKDAAIRFRIDGELRELDKRLSTEFHSAVVNRIKVLCKMDIGEKRLPQDGLMQLGASGNEIHARVSIVPAKLGEKVVLRVLRSGQSMTPLKMLVPDKHAIGFLKHVVRHTQGVFVITGPTGSGKTSTLYSMLNEVNTVDVNVVTVEDPVELVIPGITQISIHEKIAVRFDSVLKYILRQDPDVIMIGEIRDAESAQFAFEAAMTGHLVLTTLHTNHSLDVFERLQELGVAKSLLSNGLIGVMAQRLVPGICEECKASRPALPVEIETFRRAMPQRLPPRKLMSGQGCDRCRNLGYRDRVPVFEYWSNTDAVRQLLLKDSSPDIVRAQLERQGFRTLEEFGLQMVLNGLTTVEQIRRNLYGLEPEDFDLEQSKKAA